MLQPSLSGDARISVICTINPSKDAIAESTSTLLFAQRIKRVQVGHFYYLKQVLANQPHNMCIISFTLRRKRSSTQTLSWKGIERRLRSSRGGCRNVKLKHQHAVDGYLRARSVFVHIVIFL